MVNYSSKLVEQAVEEFSKLPGIGKKTALRLVLNLLKRSEDDVKQFGQAFIKMRTDITYCKECHNVSDTDSCGICSNLNRDETIVCVVEDIRDVMALENTGQYRGKYHVLGGLISPMEGIGPSDLNIDSLVEKVTLGLVKEIILALSTTIEGDTTNFYIYKRLKDINVKISTIARGIAINDNIEYADELTLGRSLVNRITYEGTLQL